MKMDGICGILQTSRLTMSEVELRTAVDLLNKEIKDRRARVLTSIKGTLRAGDSVSFLNNVDQRVIGEVMRVKTKKALVKVGGQTWDVPMGMLSKA